MRSKALLVANIFASLYSGYFIWQLVSAAATVGFDNIDQAIDGFKIIYALIGSGSDAAAIVSIIFVLFFVHIGLFALGALFGWIAFLAKKGGLATFAAILYLLGMICFPFLLPLSLTIMILGFVGSGNQKKLNKAAQ